MSESIFSVNVFFFKFLIIQNFIFAKKLNPFEDEKFF